jgi:hypothetical protein
MCDPHAGHSAMREAIFAGSMLASGGAWICSVGQDHVAVGHV